MDSPFVLSLSKHERGIRCKLITTPMDLRSQFPRSMREYFGGYVHLARMIDKCRAKHAGMLGEYIFPCPIDQRLLDFSRISGDAFLDAVHSRTDDEFLYWLQSTALPHTPQEIEDWNTTLLNRGPDTEEKREYFEKIRDSIDPTRTDITTWADLLDLDEGRKVPLRM